MNVEKYCEKCGNEIVEDGDCCTIYEGKKFCDCNKKKKLAFEGVKLG